MRHPANLALRALAASARHASALLAIAIFGGILCPPLAAALHPAVTPAVLLMTTLMLLRVDLPRALAHLRRPVRIAAMAVFQLLACPLLAWLAARALPLDAGVAAAVVIFATGCAATSSAAFARMAGLDAELALVATLATLVLVPLTAPPLALWLLGIDLSIGAAAFMARLLLVVGVPVLVSLALRRLIGPVRLARRAELVDGTLVWSLIVFAIAVVDGLTARLAADPAWVLQALLAAFVTNYGLNGMTALAFARWGRREAATAGLLSGNRNMALYLAVLPASTDPRITLFFALCQFPLYLGPILLRPAYRWLARPTDARSQT